MHFARQIIKAKIHAKIPMRHNVALHARFLTCYFSHASNETHIIKY